jgi:hypothetical protein
MDTEIEFLKPGVNYNSVKTYNHNENIIYEFESVKYTYDFSEIRKLKGVYLPIVSGLHYFHFLKEYVGSFLYYRKHINKNAKVLWLNINVKNYSYHDCNKVVQQVLDLFLENNIPIIFIDPDNIFKNNIEFEKIAIIYDPAAYIVSTQFPYFDQFKHTNNVEIRDFVKPFMQKNDLYPKKVYISRRQVSSYLEENNLKDHISRYNEKHVEDALEDFFINNGYQKIDFSGMTLQDQVMHMYNATHVAGLMGAGTWNGIFCDNGVKYFCIKTHMWFNHEYNKDMESVINLDYRLIELFNLDSYSSVVNELNQKIKDA